MSPDSFSDRAEPWRDVLLADADEMFRDQIAPCWTCGKATPWHSVGLFGAAICSDECLAAKWDELLEDLANTTNQPTGETHD